MGKKGGGTRDYSHRPKALAKRRSEYDGLLATGRYSESYFDASGGYYVAHKEHPVKENAESRERFAAEVLARHGYRVYLMPDQSYVRGLSKADGFTEHAPMDIKTVNSTGSATIEKSMTKASKQRAELMVLVQNSKDVTQSFIDTQIQNFRNNPGGRRNVTLKEVWVISMDGKRIHRKTI